MTLLPGDVLTIDSTGHQAFGPPTITQSGEPDQGTNASFDVYTNAPISSGTYKLAFLGFTTDPIDGTSGTMTDIAAAMNLAAGDTIAQAVWGNETKVPSDNYGAIQFIGALGVQAVATPTLVDDTTDGGIVLYDDSAGAPPNPVAQVGSLLLDISAFVGYQFTGPRIVLGAEPNSANCWQRVWYAKDLTSPNGLVSATVTDSTFGLSLYADSTQAAQAAITADAVMGLAIFVTGGMELRITGIRTTPGATGTVWADPALDGTLKLVP